MAIIFNGTNVAQDPLVSGTNIKTINSNSLLGSGDIVIAASVTTAAVASATAGIAVGAVGSYAFAGIVGDYITSPGGTRAGSTMRYAGSVTGNSGTSLSGTWRCMGNSPSFNMGEGPIGDHTLWLRIA
jgi:hypothetical protein